MEARAGREEEWQELQEVLKQCKDDYEYNNKNDNAYFLEGQAYAKMYTISRNKQQLLKAVASYTKAIERNPNRADYLVDRSQVYVELDQPENAVKDFQLISKLPPGKGIVSLYTKHVQKSLAKLDSIKSTIDKLRASKSLPDDFLQSYEELVNVTQGLVLKVGQHDEQIATLIQESKENMKIRKEMQKQLDELLNKAQKGQMTVKQMNKQILQLRQRVISIQKSMMKYVSKDQIEQMAASINQRFGDTEKKVEFYGSKIIIIEGQIDQQNVKVAHIDQSLLKSNIYKKNEIKEKFANLRANDAQLYEYANVFYWTFSNYVLAYRVISTGLVKGEQDDNALVALAKKVTGLFSDTISSIPGVGSVIPLIEQGLNALYDGYKAEKLERKINRINQVVSKNALQEDINLGILIAAIEISLFREPVIKANQKENAKQHEVYEKFLQARSWLQEKLDKIITSMTGIQKVYETKASKAALTDVLLLLGYLMTSDVIIVQNGQDCFHEELLGHFKRGIFEEQLIEIKKNQNKKKSWKWPWQN